MPSLRALPLSVYNAFHRRLWRFVPPASPSAELQEIAERVAHRPSDISDHLAAIFCDAVSMQPRFIVELGVRGGESRFALERAARVAQSFLLSVDIDDCSAVCGRDPSWYFVKSNDVEFADTFRDWCSQRGIEPKIDVLFIDTSHLFEQTVQEINAWFPHLSNKCKVIFHDTNARGFYHRLDGTIGFSRYAWKTKKRGVIHAIEEYLGTRFNERVDFVTVVDEWLIRHWAHCNGLTVMERTMHQHQGGDDASRKVSPTRVEVR